MSWWPHHRAGRDGSNPSSTCSCSPGCQARHTVIAMLLVEVDDGPHRHVLGHRLDEALGERRQAFGTSKLLHSHRAQRERQRGRDEGRGLSAISQEGTTAVPVLAGGRATSNHTDGPSPKVSSPSRLVCVAQTEGGRGYYPTDLKASDLARIERIVRKGWELRQSLPIPPPLDKRRRSENRHAAGARYTSKRQPSPLSFHKQGQRTERLQRLYCFKRSHPALVDLMGSRTSMLIWGSIMTFTCRDIAQPRHIQRRKHDSLIHGQSHPAAINKSALCKQPRANIPWS